VACLDGESVGFLLLEPMQYAKRVILIDATIASALVGTMWRFCPRLSKDYPRTLTVHDIGLQDLLLVFICSVIRPRLSCTQLLLHRFRKWIYSFLRNLPRPYLQ